MVQYTIDIFSNNRIQKRILSANRFPAKRILIFGLCLSGNLKWVYKTKLDSSFTQREGIDYNETFSLVLCKDSFRIIMALVAHYDLELHQMDVKMAFLNGNLEENVYVAQLKGFVMEGKERVGCRLKKFIYGLKQASRQWYLKFDQTIKNFGF